MVSVVGLYELSIWSGLMYVQISSKLVTRTKVKTMRPIRYISLFGSQRIPVY